MADKIMIEVRPAVNDELDFYVDDLHHIYTPRDEWRGEYIEAVVANAGYGPLEVMQIVADCKVAFDSHQVPVRVDEAPTPARGRSRRPAETDGAESDGAGSDS